MTSVAPRRPRRVLELRQAPVLALVAGLVLAAVAGASAGRAEPPAGDPAAHLTGAFGPPAPWPIIAIHAVLLPDGRVLTYGTNERGQQGAQLVYDVWDPTAGTELSAHLVLPNGTGTDIFCSAQSVIAESGEVFITGGDLTIAGKRNFSNDNTTVFSPPANDIRPAGAMAYPRWYPSVVSMPGGDFLVLGGRITKPSACAGEGLACVNVPAITPELFNQELGWRTLTGARNDALFTRNWFYPRAFLAPTGKVVMLRYNGETHVLDPAGEGSWSVQPLRLQASTVTMPSVMYAPGKILSLRTRSRVFSIDIGGAAPKGTRVADLPGNYSWSNMVVLADGKVLVNGGRGKSVELGLDHANYAAQIWDPATGAWSEGARAQKPRIYHSTSLLLPDATVLTAGGGAPGPVRNLNAEIYYPPYLYATDGSGQPAERPAILDAPAVAETGGSIAVTIDDGTTAGRVTLVRGGSVTHALDTDQRFLEADFSQDGSTLRVSIPANVNVALPGYYMLFVFDDAGVPSVSRMLRVTEPRAEEPPIDEPPVDEPPAEEPPPVEAPPVEPPPADVPLGETGGVTGQG